MCPLEEIHLKRGTWFYDPDEMLGRAGGFGAVFAGHGEGQEGLAIKRLSVSVEEGAHRELTMAEVLADPSLTHVIPVLDAGRDARSGGCFVVMPRAERSLQDEIDQSGSGLDEARAVPILLDIARGLAEVPGVVHRDLKPANVLYYRGAWCVADFGIARFVEESTSMHTLKGCLSPPYGAPEQWMQDHATPATDIYALGCIAYAVLTGRPPFAGPSTEGFRQQHLWSTPPAVQGVRPELASLISCMLRKAPDTRPSLERVMGGLAAPLGGATLSNGLRRLAEAGAEDAVRQANEEAARRKTEGDAESRERQASHGWEILRKLCRQLGEDILRAARTARVSTPSGTEDLLEVQWGSVQLRVSACFGSRAIGRDVFAESGWEVVAAALVLIQNAEGHAYARACLLYMRTDSEMQFRWQQVTRKAGALGGFSPPAVFSLKDLALAARGEVLRALQISTGPTPIDDDNYPAFLNAWAGWLADAYKESALPPGLGL